MMAAAKKTTKKTASKKTTAKKAAPKQAPGRKLHYDMGDVVSEYQKTYSTIMVAVAVCVGAFLVYFLIFVVYLGGWSHTPGTDFVEQFGDRIQLDYEGTKLPMYGGR